MRTLIVLAGFGILGYSAYLWKLEQDPHFAFGADEATPLAETDSSPDSSGVDLGIAAESPFSPFREKTSQAPAPKPIPSNSKIEDIFKPFQDLVAKSPTITQKSPSAPERKPFSPSPLPRRKDLLASESRDIDPPKIDLPKIGSMQNDPPKIEKPAMTWKADFQSAQRRKIETMRVGVGDARTLIIGSLHGNEPLAVDVIDRMAKFLAAASSRIDSTEFFIVRTPNPDGLARKSRTNIRGIDLNRNFPSRDFRILPTQRTGMTAGSEPETRVVQRIISDFRPRRIVHIKSTRGKNGWIIHNRKTQALATRLAKLSHFKLHVLEKTWIPGSLESYATQNLGLEIITISVPNAKDVETIWKDYGDTLLTAILFGSLETTSRKLRGWETVNDPPTAAPKKSANDSGATFTGTLEDANTPGLPGPKFPVQNHPEPRRLSPGVFIELPAPPKNSEE